ncbi:MAG: hypothetical protein CL693_03055 [Cellvibrionaceae bacterium]|nr:hypothetical protein [Cellvibrionaceae bacterium]|tara:strand:- start:302 stop:910 length:609 start_codon:yes stop_codon:yes gene_type:complete
MSSQIIDATAADAQRIGKTIAAAFRHDPFNAWLLQSEPLRRTLFALYARHLYLRRGMCQLAQSDQGGEIVGATMWIRSEEQQSLGVSTMLSVAIKTLMTQGPKVLIRMLQVDAAMKKHHPKEPHLYLFTIGVLDSARGTGKGRALMVDVLNQCDSENLPVYLESTNPDNHGYYASLGFETLKVIHPIADAPPLELMWREPLR